MRKLLASLSLFTLTVVGLPAGTAQADPIDRSATHPARTWQPTTYRVKPGDTLWRIAVRMYGPSEHAGHRWPRIAEANHIHGKTIRPGQVLRIPR